MRAVLQRVTSASVEVDGRVVSEIGQGLLVLVGIHASDLPSDADHICRKVLNMRLFPNEKSGKTWDQSVMQRNFEVLLVSQFTLYGILKGNKPDFHVAMQPEKAKFFYASVVDKFRKAYSQDAVKDGVFGAMMKVNLVNDGPVTMQLDSPQPCMVPRKQLPTNSGRENLTWTRDMDDALIDAFMHECEKGNKVSGTFTTTAYDNIVNELSVLFGRKIDKDKVKNRWKTLKKNFSDVYDIFKNGMSGFAWNPTTHLWDAEPEVWDALIQSKPKAAYWKITPIPNYEKMVKLYGNDRATGEEAETAPEMRKRGYSATEQDFFESFDDLDNRISRNEVFLENIDASVDDGNGNSFNFSAHGMLSQEPSPTASTDSKKKVSKVASNKRKDSEANEITGAMHAVAEALREGNATMREQQNYKLPPISGEETWNLIKECGFDTNSLATIFCSLMKDVDKLRPILQLPAEARKVVIMEMVFGSSDLPS